MRLLHLCSTLAIAALAVACGSGGPGALFDEDIAGAFGSEGRKIPAAPTAPLPTGGDTPNPPVDSGVGVPDTGTPPADTGGGGGGACEATSKCPNDPPPDADGIASCKATLAGSCGAQYQAFLTCFYENQACTAEGTTDSGATINACTSQLSAYSSCAGG